MAERVPGAHERPVEFDEPAPGGDGAIRGAEEVIEDQEGKGSRDLAGDLCQPIPELVNYPDLKDGSSRSYRREPHKER